MSIASTITSAASGAQTILAQMQGMTPGSGNTLLECRKAPVTGVYSGARVVFIPLPTGGYRKRTEVTLWITRAQLSTPPPFQTKVVRTDMTPNVTYVIDNVDTQNALSWVLTIVNFAS